MDADGSNQVNLTNDPEGDYYFPVWSPDGKQIYVRDSAIWLMNADGSSQTAIATGSPSYVPERAPAWSPTGDRIAFTSTRSSTSQVWVMPASGGAPVQMTFESGGAFDPVWSADGTSILYSTSYGMMIVRSVKLATGEVTTYASGTTDLGQPACGASMCLVVSGAYGAIGDIIGYTSAGAQPKVLVSRGSNDVHPAVLVP